MKKSDRRMDNNLCYALGFVIELFIEPDLDFKPYSYNEQQTEYGNKHIPKQMFHVLSLLLLIVFLLKKHGESKIKLPNLHSKQKNPDRVLPPAARVIYKPEASLIN
jgi:hypothetical protein